MVFGAAARRRGARINGASSTSPVCPQRGSFALFLVRGLSAIGEGLPRATTTADDSSSASARLFDVRRHRHPPGAGADLARRAGQVALTRRSRVALELP